MNIYKCKNNKCYSGSYKSVLYTLLLPFLLINILAKNLYEINLNYSATSPTFSTDHSFCKLSSGDVVTAFTFKSGIFSYGVKAIITYQSTFTNSNLISIKDGISSKSVEISCLPAGGFVVAYYNSLNFYGVFYDNSGVVIKTEFQINRTITTFNKISIAPQLNGGYFFFWCRDQIYFRSSNSNGQLTGNSGSAIADAITNNFKAIGLSNGYTVISWNVATSLYFRVIRNDGNLNTSTITVGSNLATVNPKYDVGEITGLGFIFIWEFTNYQYIYFSYYDYEGNFLQSFSTSQNSSTGLHLLSNPRVIGLSNKNHIISFQYTDLNGNLLTSKRFINAEYQFYIMSTVGSRSFYDYEIIPYSGSSYVVLYNNIDNILSIIFFPSCLNSTYNIKSEITIDMTNLSWNTEATGLYKIVNSPGSGSLTIDDSAVIIGQQYDFTKLVKFTPDATTTNFTYLLYFPQYFEGGAECKITLQFQCYSSCNSCDETGNSTNHLCTQCRNSYYPLIDKSSDCFHSSEKVSGYYYSADTFNFKKCKINCVTCTNESSCSECLVTYVLVNDQCAGLNTCLANTYLDTITGNCVPICPDYYYGDSITGMCINCTLPNCIKCEEYTGKCIECENPYTLENEICILPIIACPSEKYFNLVTRTCDSCPTNCENCLSGTECTKCLTDFYMTYDIQCVSSCPSGTYADGSQCKFCMLNCDECMDATTCIKCNSSFNLYEGGCILDCPINYFSYKTTQNSYECKACLQNCEVCETMTECTLCKSGFYKNGLNVCVEDCGANFYEDGITRKCERCNENCKNCNSSINCIECETNYSLQIDGTCREICKEEYYYNHTDKSCEPCILNCKTCDDSISCAVCNNKYFLDDHSSCVQECGLYFYEDSLTGFCRNCVPNCEQCENDASCTKCKENYALQPDSSSCKDTCPVEYYPNFSDRVCKSCMSNCQACNNYDICDQCKSNYFWHRVQKKCVDDCGIGYYKNTTNSECDVCISDCDSCLNNKECIKCTTNFFLQADKKCYDNCPIKYYKNISTRNCDNCSENCEECIDSTTCSICEFPYLLNDLGDTKICVQTCPPGYYGDVNTNRCTDLNNICINNNPCQNNGVCYVKENGIACDCPSGYIGNNCSEQEPDDSPPIETPPTQNDLLEDAPTDSEELDNYANTEIEKMLSGEVPPDPKILAVSNKALDTKIDNILSGNTTDINLEKYQEEVNNMKGSIYSLANALIQNGNSTTPVIVTTDLFSVQLASTDKSNQQANIEQARSKNLTLIEYDECEKEMIRYYNIPSDMPLIMKQIDYSSNLNLSSLNDKQTNSSSTIIFEFYDPRTREKLDPKVCDDTTVIVKSPNTKAFANLDINKYKKLSKEGVDMFDPNSEAFKSRCYILKDPDTGKDTTANYRINKYFGNKKAECADNCEYQGLDEYGYVICSCRGLPKGEEKANSVQTEEILKFPQMNFDIVTCVKVTFKYPNFFKNPAFYLVGSFIIISLILAKIFYKQNLVIINKRVNDLVHHDCQFFDKEDIEKEDYFNFNKKKKIKKNPNMYNKIQANIEYVNQTKIKVDDNMSFVDRKISPSPVGGGVTNDSSEIVRDGIKSLNNNNDIKIVDSINITYDNNSDLKISSKSINQKLKSINKNKIYLEENLENSRNVDNSDYIDNSKSLDNLNSIDNSKSLHNLNSIDNSQSLDNLNCSKNESYIIFNSDESAISRIDEINIDSKQSNIATHITIRSKNQSKSQAIKSKSKFFTQDQNNKKVKKQKNRKKIVSPDCTSTSDKHQQSTNKLIDANKSAAKLPIDVILEDMKTFTKRYRNIYERNPNHSPTLRDYEELSPFDAVLCDRRGFKQMFLNNLTEGHIVFELIFKVSILNPLWIRILFFFFNLTLIFALNAIFFTDDLIDQRADSTQTDNLIYTFVNEFSKTLLSLIFSMIIMTVMDILATIPKKYREPFNEALKSRDPNTVRKAYYTLRRQMKKKYQNFVISIISISFFCWYYVIVFSGVYYGSAKGWINGSIIGIVLDWCVLSIAFPALRTAIRLCVRKYERLRFLVTIEYLFVIKEFLG